MVSIADELGVRCGQTGLSYQLTLVFPHNYPCSPPTIKFVTPCFHPNVDLHGNICLDILQVRWPRCISSVNWEIERAWEKDPPQACTGTERYKGAAAG